MVIKKDVLNYATKGFLREQDSTNDLTNSLKSTYDGYAATIANKVDKVAGKALSTNDLTDALKGNYDSAYSDALASRQGLDRIYDGVNLATKFATEIAASPYNGDVWAWIKARTQAGNFTGIHVGDYIPVSLGAGTAGGYTISAQTFNAQIAGIDTYWGYGDTAIVHHIDFITKTCMNTAIQYQPNDNNNGTVENNNPWLSSKLYAVLNGVNNYSTNAFNSVAHGIDASAGGILQLLPAALQNAIIQKRQLVESRYSVSGLLTTSNSFAWADTGKLWLPNEVEVYGTQIWSHVYSNGNAVQYPLFVGAAGYKGRLKTNSSSSRVYWWLSAVYSGNSTYACTVNSTGYANNNTCSYTGIYVPLCFRIG